MTGLTLTDSELLLVLRRRARMTHQQLAEQAGCTRALVCQAEMGKTSPLIIRALLEHLQGDTHGNHSRDDQAQDVQGGAIRSTQVGQDRDREQVS